MEEGFGTNVLAALVGFIRETGIRLSFALPPGSSFYTNPSSMDTINLIRRTFTDHSTVGELRLGPDVLCYTLEDTCRAAGIKIAGETAIPPGRYEIVVNESDRFKREMPLLLSVPGFEGIRIHNGNTDKDTRGCILVGMKTGPDIVYDSKRAFDLLFPEIQKRLSFGKLFIDISGGRSSTGLSGASKPTGDKNTYVDS